MLVAEYIDQQHHDNISVTISFGYILSLSADLADWRLFNNDVALFV